MSVLYKSLIRFILALYISGLPLPIVTFGSDVQTRKSSLYPYQSSVMLQDDFMTGINGGGTVGVLGWNLSGGTNTNLAGEAGRPGIFRKETSAVISTTGVLTLYASSNDFLGSQTHSVLFISRLNTNDVNTTVHIGSANSAFTSTPANGIYFQKLDADTNWFCVSRDAAVQTRTDSGVAVNTSFNTFKYNREASSVLFFINNTLVCTHTTNIPTATAVNPNIMIINSAAANKTIDTDYFQLEISGLAR